MEHLVFPTDFIAESSSPRRGFHVWLKEVREKMTWVQTRYHFNCLFQVVNAFRFSCSKMCSLSARFCNSPRVGVWAALVTVKCSRLCLEGLESRAILYLLFKPRFLENTCAKEGLGRHQVCKYIRITLDHGALIKWLQDTAGPILSFLFLFVRISNPGRWCFMILIFQDLFWAGKI